MTNGLWRTQLVLVWAYGLAAFFFLFGLLGGPHGGNSNSVYDMVYAPLGEGRSVRGSLAHPFAWFTMLAMAVAWLAPLFAAFLAWRGRRALKGEGKQQALRDRDPGRHRRSIRHRGVLPDAGRLDAGLRANTLDDDEHLGRGPGRGTVGLGHAREHGPARR